MSKVPYDQIDPALRPIARALPKGYGLHRGLRLPRALMGLAGRLGRAAGVEQHRLTDHVTVRVHRPPAAAGPGPVLLWIHGGGTIMGSAAQEDRFCRKLVNFTDVTVVAVDHRLAPEDPYPAPLEDCYTALRWLADQPWTDRSRIGVGGASAGGGFTAAVAQLARDRGDVELALQVLVYPMLDDRTGAEQDVMGRVMWTGGDNQLAWRWYLAGADPVSVAPARRSDLSGLAPAWIGVGTLDLFFDECVSYAERLAAAGVPVETEYAQGAFHAFDMIAASTAISQRFFASQCRAIRAALVDPVAAERG